MYKRKRSTTATRRRVRRRTALRRKSTITRNPRVSHFSLKVKSYLYNWTRDTLSTAGFWRYLSMNPTLLTSFNEHAVIFDEYKLNGVMFELRPSYDAIDVSGVNSATPIRQGHCHVAVDPCSIVNPTGAYSTAVTNVFFEQSQSVKTYKADQVVKFFYKPKVGSQVSGGGTTGRLINSPWLKCTDTAVDHRGAHVFLQSFSQGTDSYMSYDVFATLYLQFRGNR